MPTPYRPPAAAADERLPLLLNTGRIRDQWHTMTRTGRLARLMAHQREPLLDIHPEDAARLGLVEGGLARIESAHGETVLPVRLSAAQRRGEVFAAMHWTDAFSSAGPIGRLVQAATDPVSGQPELKLTAVRVTPVAPLWRGLVLRRGEDLPGGALLLGARAAAARAMCSIWPGWAPLPSGRGTESWVLDLLAAPSSAPELVDLRRSGARRVPLRQLCRGASGCLPVPVAQRGRAARGGRRWRRCSAANSTRTRARACWPERRTAPPATETGPTICACFGVGLRTLHDAIAHRRLTSVAEIGAALRAGTNCGSCLPELHAILQRAASAVDAAGAMTAACREDITMERRIEAGPLAGRSIALLETREAERLGQMLREQGAEVVSVPAVAIVDAADPAPVLAWIERFVADPADYLVLLTGEGLSRLHASGDAGRHRRRFCRCARPHDDDHPRPEAGAGAARARSCPAAPRRAEPTTEGVIALLSGLDLRGRRVGVQLYPEAPSRLADFLETAGALPDPVTPYEYAAAASDEALAGLIEQIVAGGIDAVAFTSASQARRLFELARERGETDRLTAALRPHRNRRGRPGRGVGA